MDEHRGPLLWQSFLVTEYVGSPMLDSVLRDPRVPEGRKRRMIHQTLRLIDRLGLAPDECLYLGDTGTDMMTGVNAGMLPVGAGWGFRPDELSRNGAEVIIDHPSRLLEYF